MIYKVSIKDPAKTPTPWMPKVEWLAKPRDFEFGPGLNILWGYNGSGKSTLLKLLARLLHCEQGYQPVVTKESLHRVNSPDKVRGVEIEHDGQGVRHFDPGHAVGLIGGSFDYSFGMEGIINATSHGSSGQTTVQRFDRILAEIIAGVVPEVRWTMKRESVNSVWQGYIDIASSFLKGTREVGPPTVLLDEPERSCDLEVASGLWRLIRAYSSDVQFIVASHSLFALKIPGANYIETSPGYMDKAHKALDYLRDWPEMKCAKVPKAKAAEIRKSLKTAEKKRK